jgi:hypothetical protein
MTANVKVFISHTNDAHDTCAAIYEYLTSKLVDCWYDARDMQPGQILTAEMQREIEARDVFLRVCTPQANSSFFMQLERDLLIALQATENRSERRRLAISLCFPGYQVEPLDRVAKYIDASSPTFPKAAWLDELRRALDLPMGWIVFDRRDNDYFWWIATYPEGWVVNSWRNPDPAELTLHHANCATIAWRPKDQGPVAPGFTYTEGNAIKVCALDRTELYSWATSRVGASAVLTPCGACMWREASG